MKVKKCKFCNKSLRPIKIKIKCKNMHKKCYFLFKRFIDYLDFEKIVHYNKNKCELVQKPTK